MFITTCLLLVTFCFATTLNTSDFTCSPPQDVTKISETSSSVSFEWNSCFCPGQSFEVYYVKDGNTSTIYSVSSSGFNFTNLTAGTYEFHFRTVCASGSSADIIIAEDVVVG